MRQPGEKGTKLGSEKANVGRGGRLCGAGMEESCGAERGAGRQLEREIRRMVALVGVPSAYFSLLALNCRCRSPSALPSFSCRLSFSLPVAPNGFPPRYSLR